MAKSVTILDVAALAGVSKSAASLALRGTGYVSQAKREAVLRAAASLGYRPNAAARTLGARRSGIIGVILDDMRNPWFVPAVEALSRELNTLSLQPLLGDWRLQGAALVERFLELQVDGIVLVGTLRGAEAALDRLAGLPVVQLGSPRAQAPGAEVVSNDDAEGARLVVRHFASLGYRRIVHLSAPGTAVGERRREGFEQEAERLGIHHRTIEAGLTEEAGHAAALSLLTAGDLPDAVFAVNDMVALGVLSAAEQAGLRIPRELALCGYDDTPVARLRAISLSSVANASAEAGGAAARLLGERLATDGRTPREPTLLPPQLMIRASTARPPSNA